MGNTIIYRTSHHEKYMRGGSVFRPSPLYEVVSLPKH